MRHGPLRFPAFLFLTAAVLAACGSGTSSPFVNLATPIVSGSGVQNGTLSLSSTASTIQVSQAGYSGTYTFTIANSSVATLSVPASSTATALQKRRDSSGPQSVSDDTGTVTVTPAGPGSTTLTVQTNQTLSVTVNVSGSSASPMPTPTAVATATPTATPTPNALVVSQASLTFTSTGSSATQTVTASEVNFTGTLSETDTCSGVATVSPTSSASPFVATVTPVAAGNCTITFSDGIITTPVAVSVTTSGIVVNSKWRL